MPRSIPVRTFAKLLVLLCIIFSTIQLNHISRADTPGTDTLNILSKNTIPARDQVELAKRLLGLKEIPPTPDVPPTYNVGDQTEFITTNADDNKEFKFTAVLRYATPHVYMWFNTNAQVDDAAIKSSAEKFEAKIYPTVHQYFGRESSPGIDNDVHLYIMNTEGLGQYVAGYFDSKGQFPAVVLPGSNQHQGFFMNLQFTKPGTDYYDSVLAHEFLHMVHSNVDKNEQSWLDEGLAEVARNLAGYNDLGFIPHFMTTPQTQLNVWSVPGQGNEPHYGASNLFVAYFLQRFGENALNKLIADEANGLVGFRNTLSAINATDPRTNKPITLEDFFADWTVTNLINDERVENGLYHYTLFNQKPPAPAMSDAIIGSTQTATTSQWGTTYLAVKQPGQYKFTFAGKPTVKVIAPEPYSGKMLWWSSSDDRSDTRLTREFDLTGVQTATLSYWLWYAIERDWDYGYVIVSEDNGATWQALTTADSVPTGGHNNPYGAAYTGFSGGADNQQAAQWRQQSADLSTFAGKKILVRFEYLTDDATTFQGMALDDISVPEINYNSDSESGDDGWQAEGWVRIENVLPQRYIVQLVEYGPTPRITRLINPDGTLSGEWTINVGGDVSQAVIVVSGVTEFTTETAPFEYTLTAVGN